MEKINRFLSRSKTFNSYDKKKQRSPINKQPDDTVLTEFDRSQQLALHFTHLAKVSNPSDPHGTLVRLETENLQRPKIKRITGLGKAHRNSFSSEDITIRSPSSASPKPAIRQERTKTMFDFFSRTKKSPLPTKKSPLPTKKSTTALPDGTFTQQTDNRRTRLEPSGGSSLTVPRKDSANMVPLRRKPAELSSVEIDISSAGGGVVMDMMKQLQYMRTYSRSMNDVMKVGLVKELKNKLKDKRRISLVNKEEVPSNIQPSLTSPSSKRRSSLPTDLKDLPIHLDKTIKHKRDKTMANHQQAVSHVNMSSSSTVNKNSQHDLVPKSPTTKCMGDSSTNEANQIPQKNSTNRKTIKNILQKFLSRRPTQQDLVTKGIIQEQRIFGNSLRKLSENVAGDRARVPEFVTTVVRMLELERNVVSHGIYRASGNVATIQKIRVRLNEGKNLDVLLQEFSKDVDVLTGSLKLFFRELAEPLISTEMFTELCSLKDKDPTDPDRLLSEVDEIVRRQPDCHRDVLLALVKHLLYVVSFSEQNSMSIESMSIVWGPSLIFTDSEDGATLLQRMTNNNSIVNFLLSAYNESFKREQYITMRSYYSESTLSLCSTSEKGSTSRSSYKQQHSIDYSIEDIELLLRNIEKSECAKRINIYVNSKMKKSKKIIERIKARKTIDKYFSTNDGLSGIVGALKTLVQEFKVVPAELTDDYDGTPLPFKDIEAALDRLPISNRRILELVLNHLNLMLNLNPNKYSQDLLIEAWTKYLFVSQIPNENLYKYFEQLLGYYQRLECDKGKQSTRQKQMIRDMNLNESFRMRGRTSESETSLDDEVLTTRCSSTSLNGDVEIRKSVKLHEKGEEQKRNNRNS